MVTIDRTRWTRTLRDGFHVVYMRCPKCGVCASLEEHTIDEVGRVTPSVCCPAEGCNFHDHVMLEWFGPDPIPPLEAQRQHNRASLSLTSRSDVKDKEAEEVDAT